MSKPAAPASEAPPVVSDAPPSDPIATIPVVDESSFIDSIEQAFGNTPAKPVEDPKPTDAAPADDKPADPPTDDKPADKPVDDKSADDKPSDDPLAELDDLESSTKDWTPQAARRFKELKAELKAVKAQLEERDSEATQLKSRTEELQALADNPEFKAMQERLAEYETKLMVTRLEETAAFKSAVAEPLNKLAAEAEAIANKTQIDPDDLFAAIALEDEAAQDERLSELLATASDRDKARIYRIIDEVKPIVARRDELVTNAEAALREAEALEDAKKQESLRERAQARQTAAERVLKTVETKVPFLKEIEGVDTAALLKEAASVDPGTLDPTTGAYQIFTARLFPKMVAHVMGLQQELEKLTSRLAEYDEAEPSIASGSPGGSSGKQSDGLSFVDAISRQLGS